MSLRGEITTIATSLEDISARITTLVETSQALPQDVFIELVAAERTIGTLLRRLSRLSSKVD
jgi:hypothetical protein